MVQRPNSSISKKHCNRVLHCLRKNAEALKTFLTTCNILPNFQDVSHSFQIDHIVDCRFTKTEVTCTNSSSFNIYNRDPCEALMKRMATAMLKVVVTEHQEAIIVSHLLSVEIGTATCKAVERDVLAFIT